MSKQVESGKTFVTNVVDHLNFRKQEVGGYNWRSVRDEFIRASRRQNVPMGFEAKGGKWMDVIPQDSKYDEVEAAIAGGEWLAYNLMLDEPSKGYIQRQIRADFASILEEQSGQGNPVVIADFGAGTGGFTRNFMEVAANLGVPSEFYLVDRNPFALKTGWENFSGQKLDYSSNQHLPTIERKEHQQKIHFIQGDVTKQVDGFPNGEVDIITSINVPHHLTSEEVIGLCDQIYNSLKPGGRFIIEDTEKLPNNPMKPMLEMIIRKKTSLKALIALAIEQGIEITAERRLGFQRFSEDAPQAFRQSMKLEELVELIKESKLGQTEFIPGRIVAPTSPHKHIYPKMNYVLGRKQF